VKIGTPGTIIYTPVLLAQLDDGRLFIEVNPDIDGLDPDPLEDLRALAASSDIGNVIDWPRVKDALERKDGLAREVTIRRVLTAAPAGWMPRRIPLRASKATFLER
jgi:L,D-transpeptidase ErfK/SrfK